MRLSSLSSLFALAIAVAAVVRSYIALFEAFDYYMPPDVVFIPQEEKESARVTKTATPPTTIIQQKSRISKNMLESPPTLLSSLSTRQSLKWFFHFHKAAGTSFTGLARENKETVRHSNVDNRAGGDSHGHIELGQAELLRWELFGGLNETSCQVPPSRDIEETQIELLNEELAILNEKNITFVSSEHWFPSQHVLSRIRQHQLVTVIILRHPIERLKSSYTFNRGAKCRCPTPPEPESRQCPLSEWWSAEANLYVSMLNGLPWGPAYPHLLKRNCVHQMLSVSKDQYEMALKSLQENFDLILTLDSFKHNTSLVSCAMKQVLGWSKTSMSRRNRSGGGKKLTIEPDVLEQIEKGNYWDIQLYKQAQELEAQFFSKLQNCRHE